MAVPLTLRRSRTYPFPVEPAFDFTIATPLPGLFCRWYGPLPPITSVDGPETWDAAGLARVITTADGGTMREELLTVDPPTQFTYRLDGFTGALTLLVSSIEGAWSFEPVGTGTRVEWRWTLHPKSGFAAAVLPIVGRLWQGYARRALDQLDVLMVAELDEP